MAEGLKFEVRVTCAMTVLWKVITSLSLLLKLRSLPLPAHFIIKKHLGNPRCLDYSEAYSIAI